MTKPREPRASIDRLVEQANESAVASVSLRTQRDYAREIGKFRRWCNDVGEQWLPAAVATVLAYLTLLQKQRYAPGSIVVTKCAINYVHELEGVTSPTKDRRVVRLLKSMQRTGRQPRRATPIELADLRKIVELINGSLKGKRDRGVLLVGWHGEFSRELATLDRKDVEFAAEGLRITKRRGNGRQSYVGIPYDSDPQMCPVRAMRAWINALDALGVTEGNVFRSVRRHDGKLGKLEQLAGKNLSNIVKDRAKAVGLVGKYSMLSLRRGADVSAQKARMFKRREA